MSNSNPQTETGQHGGFHYEIQDGCVNVYVSEGSGSALKTFFIGEDASFIEAHRIARARIDEHQEELWRIDRERRAHRRE